MPSYISALIAAVIGYGIFGFSFIFSKLALDSASPTVLLAMRFLTAFLILTAILLFGRQKISFKNKPVAKLLLLGLFQPILYFICEAHGIALTTSSFSGVIIGLSPVAGVVLGRLFLKEHCSPFRILCALLSVIGVALTALGDFGTFSLPGLLLLTGAVLSAAAFTIVSRSIAEKFTAFERTYAMFAMGSAVFVIMALIENRADPAALIRPIAEPTFIISILYLAGLSSVCAFLLINRALNRMDASHTLILSNFTTVVSVLAGIFIMGDGFNHWQITGVVIILISVFGISFKQKNHKNTKGAKT